MNKQDIYTCCKCGRDFIDDTQEAQDLYEFYGWIRCPECDVEVLTKIMGEDLRRKM